MLELTKSSIKLSNGTKFIIIHNLPDQFGLSIDCALDNWLSRTRKFTAGSFCKYIMSKDPEFIAMTEKQYNRLNK